MTHASAHLLDSITNRINEYRNMGNTASNQLGSLSHVTGTLPFPSITLHYIYSSNMFCIQVHFVKMKLMNVKLGRVNMELNVWINSMIMTVYVHTQVRGHPYSRSACHPKIQI